MLAQRRATERGRRHLLGSRRGEKFRVWVDCAPGYRAHGPWRTGENETSRVYCNVAADARTGLGHELVIST
ncbi:hypothetical protein [Pseudonocardia sp. GCM10023141]|uniref:hypothetical protein n=1 Tax=Pseudonocardia sp. GCM10023141 TaxID=3252653 RepID=UPI00361CE4A0